MEKKKEKNFFLIQQQQQQQKYENISRNFSGAVAVSVGSVQF